MRDRWNINILIYPKPFLYFRFTSLSLNHRLNYAILEPTPYDSSFYLNAYQWISNLYNINFSYLYISLPPPLPPSLPITSSLIKELSSKIIIITYLTTLRISLYHFILPLACTYTYAHGEKWVWQKDLLFPAEYGAFRFARINAPVDSPPPSSSRKRKKEPREGYGATHWRVSGNRLSAAAAAAAGNRKKPEPSSEIEVQGKNRVPFIFTIGSRLNRSAAVSSAEPKREREKGEKEREGKESMCDTRGSPSSFLLVSSARGGSVSWVERYHHQPAPFFQPKRAEPPFPLNPRPRSSPHPPLLPRGFPPPNRFQRASGTRDREIDSGETKKFEFVFNNLRAYFNLRRKRRKRKNSFLEKYACKKIGEVENRGVWIKMVGVYTWFLSSDMLQYWTTCTVVRWTDSLFARHYERSCYRKS